MSPLVAYYRVSTAKQCRSGLGLEAQRAAVVAFAKAEGFEISAEFTEIETGKGADALARRPKLNAAWKAAKMAKCEVAVAKLDRLSRDVAFIASLMSHGCRSLLLRWVAMWIRSRSTSMRRWPSRSAA